MFMMQLAGPCYRKVYSILNPIKVDHLLLFLNQQIDVVNPQRRKLLIWPLNI